MIVEQSDTLSLLYVVIENPRLGRRGGRRGREEEGEGKEEGVTL